MAPAEPDISAARAGRRLLIVDDDDDFAESLLDLLEPLGYVISFAASAQRAHLSLQSFDAQVALLDIRLGAASGVDLSPASRSSGRT